jgi:hypothetical protein
MVIYQKKYEYFHFSIIFFFHTKKKRTNVHCTSGMGRNFFFVGYFKETIFLATIMKKIYCYQNVKHSGESIPEFFLHSGQKFYELTGGQS